MKTIIAAFVAILVAFSGITSLAVAQSTTESVAEEPWYKTLVGGALYCRGPGGSFTMWVSESTMEWSTDTRSGPWEVRPNGWWRQVGGNSAEQQIELRGSSLVFHTSRGEVKCKF